MRMRKTIMWLLTTGLVVSCTPSTGLMVSAEEETPTLTVAIVQNANVENYDTNYLTQLIEQECGVNLEFQLLPTSIDDAKSKFALMASSGEKMPDVVCMEMTNLEVSEYGSKGIIVPMNEYLEDAEVTPNFNAIDDEGKAAIMQAITSPDGNIYTYLIRFQQPC